MVSNPLYFRCLWSRVGGALYVGLIVPLFIIQSGILTSSLCVLMSPKCSKKCLVLKTWHFKKTYLKVWWKKKLGEIQCPVVFLPGLLMTSFLFFFFNSSPIGKQVIFGRIKNKKQKATANKKNSKPKRL